MTIRLYYTSKDGASVVATDGTAYAFVFQSIVLFTAQAQYLLILHCTRFSVLEDEELKCVESAYSLSSLNS